VADPINEIVQVSITANSKTPSRLGFGTPLILTYHARFAELFRVYTDLAGMAADGFTSDDTAYGKASAIFAQDPTVAQVIVGRLPSAPSFSKVLTVLSAVEGQRIVAKVRSTSAGAVTDPVVSGGTISPASGTQPSGTEFTLTYVIPNSATTTTVAVAFEQLIEAVPGVTSTSAGAVITALSSAQLDVYDTTNVSQVENTAAAGYDAALTALQDVNDDWYFILIDSSSPANIAAVAAWTLSHPPKLFFWDSADTTLAGGVTTSGTIGETAANLKAAANDRVIGLYHPYSREAAAAAWVGVGAPQDPGAITWALKTLRGVTAKSLTATQRTNLEAVNVNHYQPIRGINVTRKGIVASGEWIDVRHGIDALTADIQESIFAVLANSLKVPFTGAGLDVINSTLKGSLKRYEGSDDQPGLLIPKTSKTIMPALSSISAQDKQNRQLKNVRFTADLAGAIHLVSIVGTVSN
jgi:hypothetical protein